MILYICLTSPYDIRCAEKLLVGYENVETEIIYTVFYAYICWQSLIITDYVTIITITITVYGSSTS